MKWKLLWVTLAVPLTGCVTLEGGIYGDGPRGTRWVLRWRLPLAVGLGELVQQDAQEPEEAAEYAEPVEGEK